MTGFDGNIITEFSSTIPYYDFRVRVTPSPNDFMNWDTVRVSGIMSQAEMLAVFIHDGNDTAKWRLKGHGM